MAAAAVRSTSSTEAPAWENVTPLDAAAREHAEDLVRWLREQGAKSVTELTQ
ncbi:MAG: hypothetical protein ACRDTD_19630 [Pseudonocardiaceae bacterium]